MDFDIKGMEKAVKYENENFDDKLIYKRVSFNDYIIRFFIDKVNISYVVRYSKFKELKTFYALFEKATKDSYEFQINNFINDMFFYKYKFIENNEECLLFLLNEQLSRNIYISERNRDKLILALPFDSLIPIFEKHGELLFNLIYVDIFFKKKKDIPEDFFSNYKNVFEISTIQGISGIKNLNFHISAEQFDRMIDSGLKPIGISALLTNTAMRINISAYPNKERLINKAMKRIFEDREFIFNTISKCYGFTSYDEKKINLSEYDNYYNVIVE